MNFFYDEHVDADQGPSYWFGRFGALLQSPLHTSDVSSPLSSAVYILLDPKDNSIGMLSTAKGSCAHGTIDDSLGLLPGSSRRSVLFFPDDSEIRFLCSMLRFVHVPALR